MWFLRHLRCNARMLWYAYILDNPPFYVYLFTVSIMDALPFPTGFKS